MPMNMQWGKHFQYNISAGENNVDGVNVETKHFTLGRCLLGRLQSLGQKPSLKNCIESYPALGARKHIHSLLVVVLVEFLGHGFERVTLKNANAWPCDGNEIVLPRLNQMPLP